MKKNKIILLFYFALLLLSSSCLHPNFYSADQGNTLKIQDKKDLKVAGSLGTSILSKLNGAANFQAGYSPIKHIGLFGNHSRFKEEYVNTVKVNYSSGAIGCYYFLRLKNQHKDSIAFFPNGFLFESYIGYGRGNNNNEYSVGGSSNLNFEKKLIHIGIHRQHKLFGISLVAKFGNLNFYDGILNGRIDSASLFSLNKIIATRNFPFREYSLEGFYKFDGLQFYSGINSTFITPNEIFNYKRNFIYFGMTIDIENYFRCKRKTKNLSF